MIAIEENLILNLKMCVKFWFNLSWILTASWNFYRQVHYLTITLTLTLYSENTLEITKRQSMHWNKNWQLSCSTNMAKRTKNKTSEQSGTLKYLNLLDFLQTYTQHIATVLIYGSIKNIAKKSISEPSTTSEKSFIFRVLDFSHLC